MIQDKANEQENRASYMNTNNNKHIMEESKPRITKTFKTAKMNDRKETPEHAPVDKASDRAALVCKNHHLYQHHLVSSSISSI